ncbi:unnamed protein product [Orchesella dallaii]|uniref:C2H2-type domain-containing protein n=1 Tax=Orchesella dallaii TaxID=48710 RepID=A0ABP1QCX3_9HEXA
MAKVMSLPATPAAASSTASENQADPSNSSTSTTQPNLLQLEINMRMETMIKLQEAALEESKRIQKLMAMLYGVGIKVEVENSPSNSDNEDEWETPARPATPETDFDSQMTSIFSPTSDTKWHENQTLHGLQKTTFTPTGKQIWICYCKRVLTSYPKMHSHFVKRTQPKRLQCKSCWKRFHLGYQLKKHCKKVHGISVYVCSMCFFQFWIKEEFHKHLETSLFETDCAIRLREKRRKHEPHFTPLKEGTYGMLSVRQTEGNYDEFEYIY